MILDVNQYKDGVLTDVASEYSPKELELEFVDLRYISNVGLSGSVERCKNTLTFRGTMSSRIDQTCNRCLEHITQEMVTPFHFTYEAGNAASVDTITDLRDALLLQHPEQFLCRPDCRGLCSHCGANLNTNPCRCQKDE